MCVGRHTSSLMNYAAGGTALLKIDIVHIQRFKFRTKKNHIKIVR